MLVGYARQTDRHGTVLQPAPTPTLQAAPPAVCLNRGTWMPSGHCIADHDSGRGTGKRIFIRKMCPFEQSHAFASQIYVVSAWELNWYYWEISIPTSAPHVKNSIRVRYFGSTVLVSASLKALECFSSFLFDIDLWCFYSFAIFKFHQGINNIKINFSWLYPDVFAFLRLDDWILLLKFLTFIEKKRLWNICFPLIA